MTLTGCGEFLMQSQLPQDKPPSAAHGKVDIVAEGPDWEAPAGEVAGKLPGDFEIDLGGMPDGMWRRDGDCLTEVFIDLLQITQGDRDAAVEEYLANETKWARERDGSFRPEILARTHDRTIVSAPNGQVDPAPNDRVREVFLDAAPGKVVVVYVHGSATDAKSFGGDNPFRPCKDPDAGKVMVELKKIVDALAGNLTYRPYGP